MGLTEKMRKRVTIYNEKLFAVLQMVFLCLAEARLAD